MDAPPVVIYLEFSLSFPETELSPERLVLAARFRYSGRFSEGGTKSYRILAEEINDFDSAPNSQSNH
jgi:hypothetical protein